ncbi:Hypothetical protein SRAE_2000422300 [Strongyloides ratti]|uniref:Nematode fatty acid retinoid binding family-containing protein n=1 Tax=Strongyloides ratti TaxID=34506 RepID=A0A090LPU8_STRRB|nr:Hypothetical protein SRAE_2000422300 [Strongyloides ratti]CEF69575.1 Hypothetical protein SRAE_2000422300 [Strongyloides ratti]
MKNLFYFLLSIIIFEKSTSIEDFKECYTKSVEKIEYVFGNFLTTEQGLKFYTDNMNMYLMNKSLFEMSFYHLRNRSKFLNPGQINVFNNVVHNLSTILGSYFSTLKFLTKLSYSFVDIYSSDRKIIDNEVSNNFKKGLPLNTIKREACYSIYKLITEEKKSRIVNQIKILTPSDKFNDCLNEMRRLIKL